MHYIHTLHYTTLHYSTLHYTTLQYITLHYIHKLHACMHACTHTYIHTHLHYITLHYITFTSLQSLSCSFDTRLFSFRAAWISSAFFHARSGMEQGYITKRLVKDQTSNWPGRGSIRESSFTSPIKMKHIDPGPHCDSLVDRQSRRPNGLHCGPPSATACNTAHHEHGGWCLHKLG